MKLRISFFVFSYAVLGATNVYTGNKVSTNPWNVPENNSNWWSHEAILYATQDIDYFISGETFFIWGGGMESPERKLEKLKLCIKNVYFTVLVNTFIFSFIKITKVTKNNARKIILRRGKDILTSGLGKERPPSPVPPLVYFFWNALKNIHSFCGQN